MHRDAPMSEFVSIGQAAARVVRGLTEKQHKAREGKLTGSRIAALMNGKAEDVHRLWLEMTGQAKEPDLSNVWPVQLGLTTESLNLDWAEHKLGEQIVGRGAFIQHPAISWAGVTLDGRGLQSMTPIETKHCGGYEPLDTIIDRYQPQMQWIMECTETTECALSVIFGANEPIIEFIPRDAEYAAEIVRRGWQFMRHVMDHTLPIELPKVSPPIVPSKSYDMTGSNIWASSASVWLETKDAADRCKGAEKDLKGLVSADAKECSGHGVIVKRDRAGRLSLRAQS